MTAPGRTLEPASADLTVTRDIRYARVGETELGLDLYRPASDRPVPVVVYVHGGAFQVGDKGDDAEHRLAGLAAHGIAVASVNYRFASQALHPAQIHDVKGALRSVRAHGADLGLATDRIGLWGASAGAYLAAMVALSDGDAALEGDVGGNTEHSSAVAAVVSWFGASDLAVNSRRTWLEKELLAPPVDPPLFGLDGAEDGLETLRANSPVNRVHAQAPPFLIAHGDADRITPVGQSLALHDALVRVGASSTAVLLGGAGHEGPEFDAPAHLALTAGFLLTTLRGTS